MWSAHLSQKKRHIEFQRENSLPWQTMQGPDCLIDRVAEQWPKQILETEKQNRIFSRPP
jgi:hypothetical protein